MLDVVLVLSSELCSLKLPVGSCQLEIWCARSQSISQPNSERVNCCTVSTYRFMTDAQKTVVFSFHCSSHQSC